MVTACSRAVTGSAYRLIAVHSRAGSAGCAAPVRKARNGWLPGRSGEERMRTACRRGTRRRRTGGDQPATTCARIVRAVRRVAAHRRCRRSHQAARGRGRSGHCGFVPRGLVAEGEGSHGVPAARKTRTNAGRASRRMPARCRPRALLHVQCALMLASGGNAPRVALVGPHGVTQRHESLDWVGRVGGKGATAGAQHAQQRLPVAARHLPRRSARQGRA